VEEGDCIVCLEIRANKLIRRLILGKLTIYSVVRTSLEPLQLCYSPYRLIRKRSLSRHAHLCPALTSLLS
jgi:hypothetical protein